MGETDELVGREANRNVRIGRRIAIVSTLGIIALILYALARGESDERSIGLGLLALPGAHVLIVAVGARVAGSPSQRADPAR